MTENELSELALAIGKNVVLTQKEVLTLDEAARYTGLKKSYLYKLTASRVIPHYKPNGKNCFFRRAELEEWLTSNPIATTADLNGQAQAYCMRNRII
ncbi:helix-turn-helix domain-containing protein [uncultured Duncaniella sp.]|uniref:helix-turn-helix transcriptional regulator n=1 Tax=uncultured Duncaniella sp. TaxID=2768039 RepID=UPI0025B1D7A1|nr:helix-turn-helix domain-containing protein [uncultured Duncaniella sp.]